MVINRYFESKYDHSISAVNGISVNGISDISGISGHLNKPKRVHPIFISYPKKTPGLK